MGGGAAKPLDEAAQLQALEQQIMRHRDPAMLAASADCATAQPGKPGPQAAAAAAAAAPEALPATPAVIAEREKQYAAALEKARLRTHFVPLQPEAAGELDKAEWKAGKELRIACATWNMEGKGAPEDLTQLLQGRHHIYAVGTQECLRTIPKSFLNSEKAAWEVLVQETLGPGYSMLASETLVATHIVIFIRNDVRRQVCEASLETSKVTTGLLGGNLGNKGGVGIGFVIGPADCTHSISLLFLSAHFAAHQDAVAERNADYSTIVREMKLGRRGKSLHRLIGSQAEGTAGDEQRDVTDEYDLVFFMGDFNYRVDGRRAAVEEMLRGNEDARVALLSNDQLSREQRQGRTFKGFKEAQIAFLPTYKFGAQTDDYETKKMRIPSWTDRVLFKQHPSMLTKRHMSLGSLDVVPCEYTSMQAMRFSDHRPVRASFVLATPLPEATTEPVQLCNVQESSTCSVM